MAGARLRIFLGTVAVAAVTVASAASAAPVIAITSPTNGSSVSASSELMDVAGTVSFDAPVATARRWFLRRDDCGGTADNPHLSTKQGSDGGDGCGNLLAPVSGNAESYSAVDGLPATLEAGEITGQLTVSSFQGLVGSPVGVGAGQWTANITIGGSDATGRFVTVAQISETYLVTPNAPENTVPFSAPLDASLVGSQLRSLTMDVEVVPDPGSGLHGFIGASGTSYFDLPILDAGTVQVSTSTSFSPSTTATATVNPDGTWHAEVPTPSVGTRQVRARAIQSGVTTTAAPVTITVVP